MTSRREGSDANKGVRRHSRRDARGRFTSGRTDGGRPSSSDQGREAKAVAKRGQGAGANRR